MINHIGIYPPYVSVFLIYEPPKTQGHFSNFNKKSFTPSIDDNHTPDRVTKSLAKLNFHGLMVPKPKTLHYSL